MRLARLILYFLWLVVAACAVGMFLGGSPDIGIGVVVGLALLTVGAIEFERFAKRVGDGQ